MLQLFEKIFASLLILAVLIIVMFVAFPDRLGRIAGQQQTAQPETVSGGEAPLAKGDAKTFEKTTMRLADSSDNQRPLYRTTRRETPRPTPAPPARKRHYSEQPRTVSERRYYVRRPARAHQTCESCLCDCERPYWARSSSWSHADCYYY